MSKRFAFFGPNSAGKIRPNILGSKTFHFRGQNFWIHTFWCQKCFIFGVKIFKIVTRASTSWSSIYGIFDWRLILSILFIKYFQSYEFWLKNHLKSSTRWKLGWICMKFLTLRLMNREQNVSFYQFLIEISFSLLYFLFPGEFLLPFHHITMTQLCCLIDSFRQYLSHKLESRCFIWY